MYANISFGLNYYQRDNNYFIHQDQSKNEAEEDKDKGCKNKDTGEESEVIVLLTANTVQYPVPYMDPSPTRSNS